MFVFGIVMGTHETIMRSAIAEITPFNKRGTGYGVFNTAYGLALLGESVLIGWLYDFNQLGIIIIFTCITKLIAILLYFKINRMVKQVGDKSHQKYLEIEELTMEFLSKFLMLRLMWQEAAQAGTCDIGASWNK